MAVIITTKDPQRLKFQLINLIRSGLISMWTIDEERDITMTNPMWRNKAWLRMYQGSHVLHFGIIHSNLFNLTNEIYGVYHGNICSTLLTYFDDKIDSIEVTPDAISPFDV